MESRWLNGNSHFAWRQEPPVGRELFEVERREIAYWITGYLTRREDAPGFVEWAKGLSFVDAGVEDVAEVYNVFMGEHGWAPAAMYRQVPLGSLYEESRPGRNAPVRLEAVATKYPLRPQPPGRFSVGEWVVSVSGSEDCQDRRATLERAGR